MCLTFHFQPLYQTQAVRPVPSSYRPPPIPTQPLYASVQKKPAKTAMTKVTRHTATLSSNLSELDNLLQELNTSHYLTDVEKPVTGRLYNRIIK
jgi:BRCT domain type II-containing protein